MIPQPRSRALYSMDLEDGSRFIATDRFAGGWPRFGGLASEDDLIDYALDLWERSWRGKAPETERLKRMSLAYDGFHYNNPRMNRDMSVRNFCFSTVETVWPVMTEDAPRPQIVPGMQGPMLPPQRASRIGEFANWIMDLDEFDACWGDNTRNKLKYGWCVHLVTFDHKTGLPYPVPWSVFDFYPDPDAKTVGAMEYFFLAGPIATRRLAALFPDKADLIRSDGITSPSYDVMVKPWHDAMMASPLGFSPQSLSFRRAADPTPTTATSLIENPGGTPLYDTETTFLLQLFIRDYGTMDTVFRGHRIMTNPETGSRLRIPGARQVRQEPCCESGWRVIQFTASGVLLDDAPMDACFDGIPIVLGFDYKNSDRFFSLGEQDHVLPVNRDYNRRWNDLNRSLRYESNPVLVMDGDAGVDADRDNILPGDILKKRHGTEIKWLEYGGVAQHQFEMLERTKRDGDEISGIHDVTEGRRPQGIEAAAAIRALQSASERRIRGKENPALREASALLRKLMIAASYKLDRGIWIQGTGGQPMFISPRDLQWDYGIRWARGSGQATSREEQAQESMQLFEIGAIDQQALLEDVDYPNRYEVLARMQMQQEIAMQAAGEQGAAAGSQGSAGGAAGGEGQ